MIFQVQQQRTRFFQCITAVYSLVKLGKVQADDVKKNWLKFLYNSKLSPECFFTATDKRGYPHIIFIISARKHMLLVLIRSASLRPIKISTHNMFLYRNKKNIDTFPMKKASYLEI